MGDPRHEMTMAVRLCDSLAGSSCTQPVKLHPDPLRHWHSAACHCISSKFCTQIHVELRVTNYSQELQFFEVAFVIGAITIPNERDGTEFQPHPLLLVAFLLMQTCDPTQSLKDPTFAVELLI